MNIKLIDIAILEVLSTDMNKYFLCFSCTRKVLSAIVSANWKWLLFLWVFQIELVPSHGILPLFWQGCFVGGHRNSTGKQLSEEMATKTWYKHNLFFRQKSNTIFVHPTTITTTSSLQKYAYLLWRIIEDDPTPRQAAIYTSFVISEHTLSLPISLLPPTTIYNISISDFATLSFIACFLSRILKIL